MEKENINWYTNTTGDPFCDTGGLVIEYLQEKFPGKSMMDLIQMATDVYVKDWDNNLHSFFLNSTITHNSNKGQKGIKKTLEYYNGLLEGKDAIEGYCRITGQKGNVFYAGRDNHIMSGSATLVNFHASFKSGILLSKEALIRMFFVPLGVEQLGDKVAVVVSNKEEITRYFVRKNVEDNLSNSATGALKALKRSDFTNPANALFDYATQCMDNIHSLHYKEPVKNKDTILNLFHFTNFGAKPTISLFTLPAIIFPFYATCLVKYKKDWMLFIFRHYRNSKFKNAFFNEEKSNWYNTKESVTYEQFQVWYNPVFERMLQQKSLVDLFLAHSKKHIFNFNIIELYQINIRNMEKKTLERIKQIASFVVNDRSEDDIKKAILGFNRVSNSNELRTLLIKLLAKNYHEGNKDPLFTLEDYVDYLFCPGVFWRELRDLILIAIYQRLHETDKRIQEELIENESEE